MNKTLTLILIPLLISCSELDITTNTIKDTIIPNEVTTKPKLYFCPTNNCSHHLTQLIGSAKESVHCAFFDLDLKEIINKLDKKNKQIDVKLVLDSDNPIDKLNPTYDNRSAYMHNKFCIIDKKTISTGSFNPTERGTSKNNNNLIIIQSRYLAQNYENEFKELWNGAFGKGTPTKQPVVFINNKKIESYFCPEDSCSDKIMQTINKAKESIYFMTFSFTHEAIADAILFKDIEIKGIFEKSQAGSKYSQYHRMNDFGLDVIKDSNSYNMHHKCIIIDEKIVITGSFNPSKNAEKRNDENILIIHDEEIAKRYLEEFNYLWGIEE